jgi:hypothetical protein
MQNQIGDNDNTGEKIQALAEKLIEPNAAMRVGRSVITQNLAGSLDMVINNTFISLIPNIEAVYFIDLETQREKQELGDCILYLWDIPDAGIGVSQMSQAGYTWIVSDENAFLNCTWAINETNRIYHRTKPHLLGLQQINQNAPHDLANVMVKQNKFGGLDFVLDDIYVAFNSGIKAVYFMSRTAEREMNNWECWWSLFCDVTESGIAVVQRSKAGLTWWIYDIKAYAKACERNEGMVPTQFKISPNRAF